MFHFSDELICGWSFICFGVCWFIGSSSSLCGSCSSEVFVLEPAALLLCALWALMFHLFCANAVSLVSLAAKASCCLVFLVVLRFACVLWFGLVPLFSLCFRCTHTHTHRQTGARAQTQTHAHTHTHTGARHIHTHTHVHQQTDLHIQYTGDNVDL